MREPIKMKVMDGDDSISLIIKPMGALKAERWLTKAMFVAGPAFFSAVQQGKIEAIATAIQTVDYDKATALWDAILEGVQIESEGGVIVDLTMDTVNGKIQYPTTLMLIKLAVLKANFGFFGNGGVQNFLGQIRGVLTSQA